MSAFVHRLSRGSSAPRDYMAFADFLRVGVMRAITVRLPASTLAKLDELHQRCPTTWRSRQELLFEMIESAVADFIEAQPDPKAVAIAFQEVARKALQRCAVEGEGEQMPITSDKLESEDIDNFAALVREAIPGVPTSELQKQLRRLIKDQPSQALPLKSVWSWLLNTGWAAASEVEALFADEASFDVAGARYRLEFHQTERSCEVRIFKDGLPVNPVNGPLTSAVNSPYYRRWIGRLGVKRHLFGNLHLALKTGDLKVVVTDEKNHEGFVYKIIE